MFTGYIVATLGIMAFSLGQNLTWWIIVVFIGCFGMPFYFSYEGAIIRQITPLELQGRVFSFKDALMQGLSFIGFVCGPLLADFIFEPFMLTDGFLQEKLHVVFGSGKGSGIGLFFFICGFMGIVFTSFFIRSTHLKPLDNLPS